MERYKRFQDAGTGIVPFLKSEKRQVQTFLAKMGNFVVTFVLGTALVIVRVPLVAALVALHLAVSILVFALPLRILRRPVQRIADFVIWRFLLLILGYVMVTEEHIDKKTVKRKVETLSGINHGHVILSNHVSIAEIMYLTARYSPSFAFGPNKVTSGTTHGAVYLCSGPLSAIAMVLRGTALVRDDPADLLEGLEKAVDGPLVVFPEGTTSNGKGVLSFGPVFPADYPGDKVPCHVVGVKTSAVHPSGAGHWHVIDLLYIPLKSLSVVHAGADKGGEGNWEEKVRTQMAAAAKVQKLQTSSNDKWTFEKADK